MANLSLKHNGNIDITSASIGSGGTLNVQYGQNTTGNITGWTHNQSDPLVCGETYTITLLPQFSGTVLSENFVVSGVDEAGVPRSDTSVLRQGFDSNLLHYNPNPRNNINRIQINSSSVTETYLEVNATVVGHSSSSNTVGFYIWHYLPGDPQSKSNFVRFNVVDPVGPDTGTSITAITIVVDDFVTDNGWAGVEYAPEDASTSFVYSSSDTSKATIDPNTGEITILESGYVTFCVRDTVSGLEDCKQIYGIKTHPDTGVTAITAISISVAETIIEQGYAYAFYSPNDVEVDLAFSSSDPTIASIDPDTGEITVYQDGYVTFCVTDSISRLQDCKGSYVKKAYYIDSIEIVVPSVIFEFDECTATSIYSPAGALVDLVYSSSDPSIASIDPVTGEITVHTQGEISFCVRDRYTNISDCKNVAIVTYPKVCVTIFENAPTIEQGTLICTPLGIQGRPASLWFSKVECDGQVITPYIDITTNQCAYEFPDGSSRNLCFTLRRWTDDGGTHLGIVDGAFRSKVSAVSFDSFNTSYFSDVMIGTHCFQYTGIENLYIPDGWTLKSTSGSKGYETFMGCQNLKSVVLGDDVDEIGIRCFCNCYALSSITMTNNVTVLGTAAFYNCRSLSGITLSTGLNDISAQTFANCTSLREITLPTGMQTLGQDIFSGCTSLLFVNFPNDFNAIPQGMCDGCSSLRSFTFHQNISKIEAAAFRGCSGLTELVFLGSTPPILVGTSNSLGSTAYTFPIKVYCEDYWTYRKSPYFANYRNRLRGIEGDCGDTALTIVCTFNVTSTTVATKLTSESGSSIKKIYLEDGTVIPRNSNQYLPTTYIFSETGLTKVFFEMAETYVVDELVLIPKFNSLPDLIDITFPDHIDQIQQMLYGCSALTSITFLSTDMNRISARDSMAVFDGMPALTAIYCYSQTAPTLSGYAGAYRNISETGTLYYPFFSSYASWMSALPSGWVPSPTL